MKLPMSLKPATKETSPGHGKPPAFYWLASMRCWRVTAPRLTPTRVPRPYLIHPSGLQELDRCFVRADVTGNAVPQVSLPVAAAQVNGASRLRRNVVDRG